MNIVTSEFGQFYLPKKALLVYENNADQQDVRV